MHQALLQTDLPLPLTARGKVRDILAVSDRELLFVATDRISAFDHVLGSGIPDKGKVLTQLSLFWFEHLREIVPNHLITSDVARYPSPLPEYAKQLQGRSMLVKRAEMFPVECVVRGYISGSGWKDYQKTGMICGIPLPKGLRESDRLPEPIFTPAAKNNVGHDENISFEDVIQVVGRDTANQLRDLTLAIYAKASAHAESKGLILADTKFEFGVIDGAITLADEVLTPDSSRYWPADLYSPGGAQPSFDKQYVRDYLESIHWNKQAPAPALPEEVIVNTRAKYLEAYQRITGNPLEA
ncbi:phosphoribosylaminoimidazolesuccinocarboxamide synthase [Terriglobus albidus]|uniref:Phosphoribosylaminoimidazole-succinocarboxamide synthase n=1 Tax=Terriglobus albidus TaxID=1592106 RepID=A0A5B9EBE2_9BACT|nr:phosphoribosylaminoimidazolesuccinocarboxamide synthase [Terriglobus albidus]QEE29014.1 phosphoribosylaminoimidazolesuccinocarboxamide synthase [Terriglobus albidus]